MNQMNPSVCRSERSALSKSQAIPSVFVVDDDISVRESLELLILEAGWQAETFGSAEAFLDQLRTPGPSCLVLDVHLPGLNGLDLQKLLADRSETPIVFITGDADVRTTVQAMKAGAFEFLPKPISDDMLLNVVRRALEHSEVLIRREAERRELRDRYASLSRREREVMMLVASGLLNKQVGGELGISEITVKAHRGSMMRKMGADSFAGLVSMALSLRLTRPPLEVTLRSTSHSMPALR
jgi:FixJ family two-component response regulator